MPDSVSKRRDQILIIQIGLLVALLLSLGYLFPPQPLRLVEGKVYDALMAEVAPTSYPEQSLAVIVSIDDASLARVGQWPWPRNIVAELLGKISSSGAAAIAMDIIYAERDRTSLSVIAKQLELQSGTTLVLKDLPAELQDNDLALANQLKAAPVVLGYRFYLKDDVPYCVSNCEITPANTIWASRSGMETGLPHLFDTCGMLGNLGSFHKAAPAEGFINVTPDPDGIIRRIPLLLRKRDDVYTSLALSALLLAGQDNTLLAQVEEDGLERVSFLGTSVPTDPRGNILPIFPRNVHQRFKFISAVDILDGKVRPEVLAGRVVFIGATATALGDIASTPFNSKMPGVAVHASVLDSIVTGNHLARPYWAAGAEFALVLFLGLAMAVLLAFTGPLLSVLLLLSGSIALWSGSVWLMSTQGLYISPLIPITTIVANFASLSLLKSWREERRAHRRKLKLMRFHDAIINLLSTVVETRDSETGGHITRTKEYVRILALTLRSHPKYRKVLTPEYIEDLVDTAPLHDIGKIGIADIIMLKPGALTKEEFDEIRKHPTIGRDIIRRGMEGIGEEPFLRCAEQMAYSHHEKWDGSGYPDNLSGDDIPLPGRIMALADVYDALISERVYKAAMTHEQAKSILLKGSGNHFDPHVVEAFLEMEEEFQAIALRFRG